MAELHAHVRTLFRSDLIHVFDYRCTGQDDNGEIPQGYEIVLPRSGAYQRRDALGTFLADPNQVVFYNKGEPYDIRHLVRGEDSSTVFLLAPSLLREIIRMYHRDVENNPHKIFQRSHITLHTKLQLLQYQLMRENDPPMEPLAREEQIITAVGEIIHALYHGGSRQKPISTKTLHEHYEQTQAIKAFLNAHVRSRLQLEQVSSSVHLSPFHLCRVFKQQTGMTLHQYVQRLRLFNAAEQMLQSPAARLDLLAHEYGFSNHGHFTTTFRKTFGVSPSDFRQMSKILKA